MFAETSPKTEQADKQNSKEEKKKERDKKERSQNKHSQHTNRQGLRIKKTPEQIPAMQPQCGFSLSWCISCPQTQEKTLVICDRKYQKLQHISVISQKHTMTCNLFYYACILETSAGILDAHFGTLCFNYCKTTSFTDLNTSWKAYIGLLVVVPHSGLSEQTPSQLKHPNVK